MKRAFFLLAALFIVCTSMAPNYGKECITKDGYCKGIKLCGKVYIVSNTQANADFRVCLDNRYPDLKVQVADYPDYNTPGSWRFVGNEGNADFTIKFVDSNADFTICFNNWAKVCDPCR